ncbi:MAG: hypothetical protein L0Y56_18895, partial [Nitrospira sp.]|nr:hypothetical protein [Nitrospira sp.]
MRVCSIRRAICIQLILLVIIAAFLIGSRTVYAQEGTAPPSPTMPEPTKPDPEKEQTLQLEEPTLAPPPKEEPLSLGPISNITIGGLLDYRYIPGPRTLSTGKSFLVIHVNELFISANIGENISILAEQLLITSGRESVVGQDHGFVYATFTNIPLLPSDLSFRIGRFRYRYGIDASMDSAINPVRTLVYKNLGVIADRGLELSYFWKWFEISGAVLNGPDEKTVSVTTPTGPICCIRVGSGNKNRPVAARLSLDIPEGPKLGFSYFIGKSYPILNLPGFDPETMIFNADLVETVLILKERATIDLKYSIWRLDFAGEYTGCFFRTEIGNVRFCSTDTDESTSPKKTVDVEGYYFRTDLTIIPRKFKWLFQYDLWRDGNLFGTSS